MHKLRNTKHIEMLNSMLNIVPPGCSQPLSKRTMRILLQVHKWNKKEVLKEIENDEWWYRFCND
jgi:hypothetical protein